MRTILLGTALPVLLSSTAVFADEDTCDSNPHISCIVIHPDRSRDRLTTETGSSTYTFTNQALQDLPEGNFTPVNEALLRAPGVAQDSYGQLHIRGDHADLQYRINGIILPESITGFGQTLDTHFADRMELLTGALPAQYGYHTAGIIDITTKTGSLGNGGNTSLMGGSNNTLEGNQTLYGSSGQANLFFTGTYGQNDRGIESPTSAASPLHDHTVQDKEFGYASYAFNPDTTLSFMAGNATNRFEIPNNPNQSQNFVLSGVSVFPSSSLDERQYEHNTYGIAALQGNINNNTSYQLAVFTRDSTVLFKPDVSGDLIFNGIASRDYRESVNSGLQNDFSWHANRDNTVRFGWTASYEQATSNANSLVFPADASGTQLPGAGTPFAIADNAYQIARLAGFYLQDEWSPLDKLTLNYGARLDYYSAYVSETALSPRIGMIYELTPETKLHAGYARYFTPPPTELIAPVTIAQFANSTGQLPTSTSSPVVPEKDNYFDAGITQKIAPGLSFGMDAYYKQAHDLLDEGQFGQALIFAPFNYEKGWVRGIELTTDYNHGPVTAYANFALSTAMGKQVVSGQYNFEQDELDYIHSNAVHLDHDQLITGSAGIEYLLRGIKYSMDIFYGSGLRDGFANTDHLPFYAQVNAGVAHQFDLGPSGGVLDTKLSIINLFDRVYEIRDGSGIGVFAPQFGPRRGIYLEIGKSFSW